MRAATMGSPSRSLALQKTLLCAQAVDLVQPYMLPCNFTAEVVGSRTRISARESQLPANYLGILIWPFIGTHSAPRAVVENLYLATAIWPRVGQADDLCVLVWCICIYIYIICMYVSGSSQHCRLCWICRQANDSRAHTFSCTKILNLLRWWLPCFKNACVRVQTSGVQNGVVVSIVTAFLLLGMG